MLEMCRGGRDLSELEQAEMFTKIGCLKNGQEEGVFTLRRVFCAL